MSFALAIARATIIEAIGSRLAAIALVFAACVCGLAIFAGELALTETREVRATLAAAALRAGTVFLLIAFVVSSMVREYQDQIVAVTIAHAAPRGAYVLGKLAGYSAVAWLLASLAGAALFVFDLSAAALLWTISLALELTIVAAASLFCVLTLTHFVAAFAAVAAFYLLGRSLAAIEIIATSSGETASAADRVLASGITVVSWLMPRLDAMTRSSWLTDPGVTAAVLGPVLAQSAVYVVLLAAAALFDFSREQL